MAFSRIQSHHCTHPLNYITDTEHDPRTPSHCGACKTPIVGKSKNCNACNSFIHPLCQESKETLISQIHPQHALKRLNEPLRRSCVICNEEIMGVSYTCTKYGCEFDVHPQCSQLPCSFPHELVVGPKSSVTTRSTAHHEFTLQLADSHVANCHVCKGRCGKWAYRCHACLVNVHFWCLVSRRNEPNGTAASATTTTRGLGRDLNPPRYGQGQPHFSGVQMPHQYNPSPFPTHYYAGHYPPHGNQYFPPHGNQHGFNQFHNTNNNWGGGGGGGEHLYNHGAVSSAGGGWVGYNNNHGSGGAGSSGSGLGDLMEK